GSTAGDTAVLNGTISNTTIQLNGQQHLGNLTIDSGTNAGWTLAPGTGKLFLDSGTLSATIQVTQGNNTITANVDLLSVTSIGLNSTNGSLTISGVVNTPS